MALVVENPSANGGDTGAVGLIPGSGRSAEDPLKTHSSFLAKRIPLTEKPDGLKLIGLQRVRRD